MRVEPLEDRYLLSGYTPGPLVEISNQNVTAEPYVAVNPSNPKNIAAAWIDHPFAANVASVTFDGGKTWQNVPIPVSVYSGGPYPYAADPWLSFAPNGDL